MLQSCNLTLRRSVLKRALVFETELLCSKKCLQLWLVEVIWLGLWRETARQLIRTGDSLGYRHVINALLSYLGKPPT
jgi:hypothetical protein